MYRCTDQTTIWIPKGEGRDKSESGDETGKQFLLHKKQIVNKDLLYGTRNSYAIFVITYKRGESGKE